MPELSFGHAGKKKVFFLPIALFLFFFKKKNLFSFHSFNFIPGGKKSRANFFKKKKKALLKRF